MSGDSYIHDLEIEYHKLEQDNRRLAKKLELAEAVCGSIFLFDHTERDGNVYFLNEDHLEAWRLSTEEK